jgi:hypothetical protein
VARWSSAQVAERIRTEQREETVKKTQSEKHSDGEKDGNVA